MVFVTAELPQSEQLVKGGLSWIHEFYRENSGAIPDTFALHLRSAADRGHDGIEKILICYDKFLGLWGEHFSLQHFCNLSTAKI